MELGVMINISEDTDIPAAFAEAREAGFTRGQVTSFINAITAEEVRQIAVAAQENRFHVDAVGCYINPLRLDDPTLQGVDMTDWRTLADNMSMMNGVERIVCWSGTLGRTLGTPTLLNQEEETLNNLYIALCGMLEQVRGLPIQILLEPYTAHVLHDARSCLRLTQKFSGGEVKVVLDAPNMIAHKEFAARNARLEPLVEEMAPAVGLVHLKDMALGEDGHRLFPRAGRGALDYGAYLRAIARYLPEVPVIIEHVQGVEEMRETREFIARTLQQNSLA